MSISATSPRYDISDQKIVDVFPPIELHGVQPNSEDWPSANQGQIEPSVVCDPQEERHCQIENGVDRPAAELNCQNLTPRSRSQNAVVEEKDFAVADAFDQRGDGVDCKEVAIANPIQPNLAQNGQRFPLFLKMSRKQWGFYLRAMGFHGMRSALEVFRGLIKTAASTLVGVELSGVLQTEDVISVWPSFTASGGCERTFSFVVPIDVINATQTLGATLDEILLAPIDDMTYFFCSLWIAARVLSPPIEYCLLKREDAWLKRVSEDRVAPRKIPEPLIKRSTTAAKISFLIDLLLPFVFWGTQTALGIRTIQRVGSSFDLPGSQPLEWSFSDRGCNATLTARIDKVMMNTLAGGNGFFSTDLLIGVCVIGALMFAMQAWCDFHDGLSRSVLQK